MGLPRPSSKKSRCFPDSTGGLRRSLLPLSHWPPPLGSRPARSQSEGPGRGVWGGILGSVVKPYKRECLWQQPGAQQRSGALPRCCRCIAGNANSRVQQGHLRDHLPPPPSPTLPLRRGWRGSGSCGTLGGDPVSVLGQASAYRVGFSNKSKCHTASSVAVTRVSTGELLALRIQAPGA